MKEDPLYERKTYIQNRHSIINKKDSYSERVPSKTVPRKEEWFKHNKDNNLDKYKNDGVLYYI